VFQRSPSFGIRLMCAGATSAMAAT
jgi:hypothetical protein